MASIFTTILSWGWHYQIIKNEFTSAFRWPSHIFMSLLTTYVILSNRTFYFPCECFSTLLSCNEIKERKNMKGHEVPKCSSKVISDKKVWVDSIRQYLFCSVLLSCCSRLNHRSPQFEANNWPFLLLNEDK